MVPYETDGNWCYDKAKLRQHFRHLRDYIMGRVRSSKLKMEAVNNDKKINKKKKKV
jgi:hypothetical protein